MKEIEYLLKERGKILKEIEITMEKIRETKPWHFFKYSKLRKELNILFDKFDNCEPK